jgi:hypothetical protein
MDTGSLLHQEFDETYRDPHLVGLLLTMCENMHDTLTAKKTDDDWINNPNTFAEVAIAARETIEAYRPVGAFSDNIGQMAVAIVRSMLLKIISGGASGIVAVVRNRISVDILRRLQVRQRWYGKNGWIVPAPEEINQ